MWQTVITFSVLFGFWFALSGKLDALMLGTGLVVVLLVSWVSAPLVSGTATTARLGRGTLKVLAYFPWLIKEIIVSGVDVMRRVLHPKMPIDPKIVEMEVDLETDVAKVLLANSITLTPGTVTVEVEGNKLIIHALTDKALESLLSGEMQARVKRIELC
ncbi:MAG: Na+/H+ antiporter subunit E [Fimbriimonadales bacterium]